MYFTSDGNQDEETTRKLAVSCELKAELVSAYAELEAVQEAVKNLPDVYEAKFRQALTMNVQLNRYLLLRNKELEDLVNKEIVSGSASLLANSKKRGLLIGFLGTRSRSAVKYIGTVCLGVAIVCFALWKFNQSYAIKSNAQTVPAGYNSEITSNTLRVRSDGPSWVEVQDLGTREVLFIGELQAGEERAIRNRQGLRIRSGRPDLLTISIDGAPPTPFGDRQGLGWRTFKMAGA